MKNQKQKKEDKPARTIFVHEQHTPAFIREANAPGQNSVEPFRLMDSRWTMGRHKGLQLAETPTPYIEWVLQTFTTMAKTHRAILTNELNQQIKKAMQLNDFTPLTDYPAYGANTAGEFVRLLPGKNTFPGHPRPTYVNPKTGYRSITLKKPGEKRPKTVSAHRLVALTFLPNPEGLKEVDHINKNRSDNRVENLRWSSMPNNRLSSCKPVQSINLATGEVLQFPSISACARHLQLHEPGISQVTNGHRTTYKIWTFRYLQ